MDSRLLQARTAPSSRPVYKDECAFSFDDPESDGGLYVSLVSFLGVGRDFVEAYSRHTGDQIFLHIRRRRVPIPVEDSDEGPDKKITRLAIGVEGGFAPDCGKKRFDLVDEHSLVLLPEFKTIAWPGDDLPAQTVDSVNSVLSAESPTKLAELEALAGTWDGELRQVSTHALDLRQLDNGVKIPPTGWKCRDCDLAANLWLNLTDGAILCGRKFFDGSGGNNHAVEYFKKTGYPLAVKLGTITSDGKADVFSYAEDDMVEDPYLAEHLKHFGIDYLSMQKTEKSMVELELEANQHLGEWSLLQESSSQLKPACGPRLTGLVNLGNSCYLNSVMQVLFTLPDFIERFVNKAPEIFNAFPSDPANDFNVQTAKLGVGLVSGKYAALTDDGSQKGISPNMFKTLIGKSHPEFSTKKQQDALEYYLHFLNILTTNSRKTFDPSICLKFNIEERIECGESKCVSYTNRAERCLGLNVPLAAAVNQAEVLEYEQKRMDAEKSGQKTDDLAKVRPLIPFKACLDTATQDEIVEQFFSSAVQKKVTAIKSMRFATFPDYLMIHLKKFTIDANWTPIKLDVEVDMPWELDLSDLRGVGLRAGEKVLPELTVEVPPPQYDEAIVSQMIEMGFPRSACERALFNTTNSGMEAAMNWIMEHIADADFADPFVPPGTNKPATQVSTAKEEDVAMIMSMGFTRSQAERALRETQNDVERAADWLFSRASELDAEEAASQQMGTQPDKEPEYRDGGAKYELVAFISHMGTSTLVGHYVCHIRHAGEWVIFNDQKVSYSKDPPKNLGYLYLYKRL